MQKIAHKFERQKVHLNKHDEKNFSVPNFFKVKRQKITQKNR